MTSIQAVELMDVSGVRDNGVKALLLLARSLRWNVMQKHHQPAVITAHDGTQRRLPTDTSLRIGIFQGHLSAIIAHSEEFTPTIELIDHIVQIIKPNIEQARRMRLAMGESPQQHRERMTAHDAGVGEDRQAPLSQHVEFTDAELKALEETQRIQEEQEMVEESVTPSGGDVTVEPAMARTSSGWAYESKIATKRTWPDGTVDFECTLPGCGYTHKSLSGISGHWRWHVKKGEAPLAPPPPTSRKDLIAPEDDYQPAKTGTKIRGASEIILRIRELVGMDVDESQLVTANEQIRVLTEENQSLRERNRQLRDDWAALQDLLGRKKR